MTRSKFSECILNVGIPFINPFLTAVPTVVRDVILLPSVNQNKKFIHTLYQILEVEIEISQVKVPKFYSRLGLAVDRNWLSRAPHFGITVEEVDEIFAWSKRYFDRPLEAKMKKRVVSTFTAQGYTADGAESSLKGAVSHKECYEHGRFVSNNCPPPGELDGFKEFKCFDLCKHVLKALAIIEGNMDPEYFTEPMKEANPQLRLLHYMGIQRKTLEAEGHWRINPHCDYGLCTILFQDAVGGLEVADLLRRLSNNRLKSTRHRVTLPQMTEEHKRTLGLDDYLPPRYSTAFFPVNAGEWREGVTRRNYTGAHLTNKIIKDEGKPLHSQIKAL
ncbi:Clavaminate synthase-like protein [Acephala macrosclerotiorum]|nr:Clavaminate synthase-like protein [Acephala macrosclerotiorum]